MRQSPKAEQALNVDPGLCPLCKENNACISLSCSGSDGAIEQCWCKSPDISFPKDLLDSVPDEAKARACICQECAKAYQVANTAADIDKETSR